MKNENSACFWTSCNWAMNERKKNRGKLAHKMQTQFEKKEMTNLITNLRINSISFCWHFCLHHNSYLLWLPFSRPRMTLNSNFDKIMTTFVIIIIIAIKFYNKTNWKQNKTISGSYAHFAVYLQKHVCHTTVCLCASPSNLFRYSSKCTQNMRMMSHRNSD